MGVGNDNKTINAMAIHGSNPIHTRLYSRWEVAAFTSQLALRNERLLLAFFGQLVGKLARAGERRAGKPFSGGMNQPINLRRKEASPLAGISYHLQPLLGG